MSVSTPTTSTLPQPFITLLERSGILSPESTAALMERSKGNAVTFKQLLLQEGHLTEKQLGQLMAQAMGWHFVDVGTVALDEASLGTIPTAFLRAHAVIPYRLNDRLGLAMARPDDGATRRTLLKKMGPDIRCSLGTAADIAALLARYDRHYTAAAEESIAAYADAQRTRRIDDASAVTLVASILEHAVRSRASDIHIEPRKDQTHVRERTDGVLQTWLTLPKAMHDVLLTRIKVLSNLATDEHARPQDGKMEYQTPEGKRIDIRVSLAPTINGEKVVLRLLAAQDRSLSLEYLGLATDDLHTLDVQMERPWGMVLVTGPTGSGKTTTLYAGIRKLLRDDVNIETIEDPVEYDMPGVNQMQVHEKAGVTFATGLRSIVRQDPDVILVGEIRDHETAGIAVNAAMTGHLVLSTLHTNDAATAIPRLMDMGIEPFFIASTVNVIVAQRLVRTLCVRCRESIDVSIADLGERIGDAGAKRVAGKKKTVRLYKGKGCPACNGTGFHGRSGIFEILPVTVEIQALIMARANAETIESAAMKAGMKTMFDDGVEKALQGITTVEEVIRVTRI